MKKHFLLFVIGILFAGCCDTPQCMQQVEIEKVRKADLKLLNNNVIALEIEKNGFDEKTSRFLQEVWFCSRHEWPCSVRLNKMPLEIQEELFKKLIEDGSK